MFYLLIIYAAGLGLLSFGFLNLPESEKDGAETVPTLLAYMFWPISLVTILGRLLYVRSRYGRDHDDREASSPWNL